MTSGAGGLEPDIRDTKEIHKRDVTVDLCINVKAPQDVVAKVLGDVLSQIASRWIDDGETPPPPGALGGK